MSIYYEGQINRAGLLQSYFIPYFVTLYSKELSRYIGLYGAHSLSSRMTNISVTPRKFSLVGNIHKDWYKAFAQEPIDMRFQGTMCPHASLQPCRARGYASVKVYHILLGWAYLSPAGCLPSDLSSSSFSSLRSTISPCSSGLHLSSRCHLQLPHLHCQASFLGSRSFPS